MNPSPASPTAPLLGTRRVCQICVIVRDIEKSARDYAVFFGLPVPPIFTT